MRDDALIAFYEGSGPDHAGRRIEDIWAFDDVRLEAVHDYVQWLFPLPERSRFNPDAPLLTPAVAAALRARGDLQGRALRSLDRMLAFYGFARRGDRIEGGPAADGPVPHWLAPGNHNHLRLSRIVQFLDHVGQKALAASLRDRLLAIAAAMPARVSASTRMHWRQLPPRDHVG